MHTLGLFQDELALAREARRTRPDHYSLAAVEARALVGLGRLATVEELLTGSRGISQLRAPGRLMHELAYEREAHGHPAEARRMWERALTWHMAQPAGGADELLVRLNIALERYCLGAFAEALREFDRLLERHPDWQHSPYARMGRALAALATGDTATALAALAALRADTGTATTHAARVLALLGRREEAVAAVRDYPNRGGRYTLFEFHRVPELRALREYPPFRALVALKD